MPARVPSRSGLADNVTTSRPANVCQIRSLFTLYMLRVYGRAGYAFGVAVRWDGADRLRPGALTAADRAATGQSPPLASHTVHFADASAPLFQANSR